MKVLYSAFAACAALALVVAPASAFDVKVGGGQSDAPRVAYSCDDGSQDNAFFQNQGFAYGNSFDTGAGGPLSEVDFEHDGFGFAGPYDYNILVWEEGTCTLVGSVNGLMAQDAADTPAQEIVDTCDSDIRVAGLTVVTVEPLSCLAANDCYPDLYFDVTAPVNGCGRIVDAASGADCDASEALDFLLRIKVDECESTPTEVTSWSVVKESYR